MKKMDDFFPWNTRSYQTVNWKCQNIFKVFLSVTPFYAWIYLLTLLSIIYSSAEGGMQQQWVVYLVIYLSADIYSTDVATGSKW